MSVRVDNGLIVDDITGALIGIDFPHYHVHAGETFNLNQTTTLHLASTEFVITAPASAKIAHIIWGVSASGQTTLDAYEDTTHSSTGVAMTSFNVNRNSANTPELVAAPTTAGAADGTKIFSFTIGTQGANPNVVSGGGARGDEEWMLKTGAKYLVRLTSASTSNGITFNMRWYEHANTTVIP